VTGKPPDDDIPCQDIVELVTDYLEGALDADTARAVEAHLAGCDGCQTYLDQMRSTAAALGRVPVETLSERAQADLMAAFRGFAGSGPGDGAP
jgi:anti-sigma factor RsiW